LSITPGKDQRTRLVTLTHEGKDMLLKALPVWEDGTEPGGFGHR
jgi:hypothetical protein